MKKVLLLNPPGPRNFIRDYYCSQTAKGIYYWPALDLVVLSGHLKKYFKVYVLDALVEKVTQGKTLERVRHIGPDCVISMAAAVSWTNDIYFLKILREIVKAPILVSGDYPLAEPEAVLKKYGFIEGVLLDFIDNDIVDFILSGKAAGLKNIHTRNSANSCDKDNRNKLSYLSQKEFSIDIPGHELFPLRQYHLPHIYYHPFAVLMTDFGCPFNCAYCPFERVGYKTRNIENIVEELEYISKLGIRELWLRDQSFGSAKEHALRFCKALGNIKRRFSWSCEMRVDAADSVLLKTMKDSGCHTVMFGVETADEDVLNQYKKKITIKQVRLAFTTAKKLNLRTLAHFIIGLEGRGNETYEDIMDLCFSLDPDYASFNVIAPAWNTSFREEAVRDNRLLNENEIEVDSSSPLNGRKVNLLNGPELCRLQALVTKKFYLRPGFFVKQLKNLKTPYQVYCLIAEAVNFIKK